MNHFLKGNVMMMIRHMRLSFAFLAAAMGLAQTLHAQEYPSKLIKLVSPYAPGGSTDVSLNILKERLMKKWGQPVIIEYRPGASANIGTEMVFRSPPDGYTLLLTPSPPLTANKYLFPKLNFDPQKLTPISLVAESPNVLVFNPKLPIETVQQLITFAKANPGRLNYATTGNGSTNHLAGELFQLMAEVQLTKIPYNGTGPTVVALLGGQVDMMFMAMGAAMPHIRAGKLRALAVAGEKRSPLLPDVPTVSEVLPGFVSMATSGIVAPPMTPTAIVNKLSVAIAEIMREPEIVQRYLDLSSVAVGSTPAEYALSLKQESEHAEKVIRRIGITLD
jgi:tripartite-type tricarboxylate transporter receptor subunit TctC